MLAEEQRRIDDAMQLSPLERVVLGLRMGEAQPLNELIEAELDHRALGQAELHMKWRRQKRKRASDDRS